MKNLSKAIMVGVSCFALASIGVGVCLTGLSEPQPAEAGKVSVALPGLEVKIADEPGWAFNYVHSWAYTLDSGYSASDVVSAYNAAGLNGAAVLSGSEVNITLAATSDVGKTSGWGYVFEMPCFVESFTFCYTQSDPKWTRTSGNYTVSRGSTQLFGCYLYNTSDIGFYGPESHTVGYTYNYVVNADSLTSYVNSQAAGDATTGMNGNSCLASYNNYAKIYYEAMTTADKSAFVNNTINASIVAAHARYANRALASGDSAPVVISAGVILTYQPSYASAAALASLIGLGAIAVGGFFLISRKHSI